MSGVYLTRHDPARRMARFYRMFISPNLWANGACSGNGGALAAAGR